MREFPERNVILGAILLLLLSESPPADEVKHRLPALTSVFPQGARAGTTLRVEVLGEYLDRASSVEFLDDSLRGRVLGGSFTRLDLEFEASPAASLGPHYFRIVSPRGASNLLLFRIGDQPHIVETEPNSTLDQAQRVEVPVTINARLNTDGDFDCYRFHARAGETWVFDLRAARNGNGLDAALILLDAAGRKIAHSEDNFLWDPFLVQTFDREGDYVGVVQPTHARNDPNFAYQLDIRTAPWLQTVAPIALAPGANAEVTVYAKALLGAGRGVAPPGFDFQVTEMRGDTAHGRLRVPADARPGPYELAIDTPGGRSNPVTLLVDPTPAERGDRITPPASITGIARYRTPERFAFDARAGDSLVFEVRAQRFGSPVDSLLRLLDDKGKVLAVNDDATFPGEQFNKDSRLAWTFRQAGRYTIEMRNLTMVTGENYPYQLVVKPPEPGFDVTLAYDQPYLHPGETGLIKVTAVRRDGYDRAIPLRVAALPDGVTAEPAEIPAGKNEGQIRLRANDTAAAAHATIRVLAGDPPQPAWREVRISSGGGEGATFVRTDRAALVVAEAPRFSLEALLANVTVVRGGTAEVPVAIRRAGGFHEPIRFRMENLPRGVTCDDAEVPADALNAKIQLRADRTAPAGRSSRVAILGTAGDNTEEAPRISVAVD